MSSAHTNNVPVAFAVMMIAVLLVASMDAAAKVLTETLPLALVVWARFFFHALWMLPAVAHIARKDPRAHFNRRDILGHAMRGGFIVLATACYFAAIRDNPIPDALTVFFVEPIFVMVLAAVFLGEKLRMRRIIAAMVAFIGVLVVLRPGGGHYTPSILLALLAGLFFAAYVVATRKFAIRGSVVMNAWGAAFAGMLWSSPTAFMEWQTPDLEWPLLVLLGALAASGHFMFALACRLADASLIGVFHYSEIIAAAAISYFLFAHIPDPSVWFGFALIAGAKIALTLYEMQTPETDPGTNKK